MSDFQAGFAAGAMFGAFAAGVVILLAVRAHMRRKWPG